MSEQIFLEDRAVESANGGADPFFFPFSVNRREMPPNQEQIALIVSACIIIATNIDMQHTTIFLGRTSPCESKIALVTHTKKEASASSSK